MKELIRVVKTFFAYLIRPSFYPELGRKIYKNLFNRNAAFKGKERANQWAAERAISQKEAVEKLFGMEYQAFSKIFPSEFSKAKDFQNKCPIKMGGAGALELIYYACEFTKAKNVVETGVAYGWSSLAALLSLQKRDGVLYSSDMPYLSQDGDKYVGCVVPENLRENWKLFRYADRESLPKILSEIEFLDVVHYDSDKAYEGMMFGYQSLYPRLKKGGVFISDDINDNAAFQDFCYQENIQPTIIDFDNKFIGVFIKE